MPVVRASHLDQWSLPVELVLLDHQLLKDRRPECSWAAPAMQFDERLTQRRPLFFDASARDISATRRESDGDNGDVSVLVHSA
jgi:hypothetical protein